MFSSGMKFGIYFTRRRFVENKFLCELENSFQLGVISTPQMYLRGCTSSILVICTPWLRDICGNANSGKSTPSVQLCDSNYVNHLYWSIFDLSMNERTNGVQFHAPLNRRNGRLHVSYPKSPSHDPGAEPPPASVNAVCPRKNCF